MIDFCPNDFIFVLINSGHKTRTYFHTSLSGKLALFMNPQDKDNGKQIFFWILFHASLGLAGFNL